MRLTKKTVIVAHHESTYGTPPTFDYTSDAFEILSGELTFPHERVAREVLKQTIGASAEVTAGIHAQLRFQVEMKGSGVGASGVIEPRIGRLIESCLFSKTVNTDTAGNATSYDYIPSSGILGTDIPSIAFEVYYAGEGSSADKYVLVGCGGTFKFTGAVGKFPVIEFTFIGKLYSDPVTATIPTVTYDSTLPFPFQGVTLSFDSKTDFCVNQIEIDCGNTTALRKCISEADGIGGVLITKRNVTGSIDPEAVLQSDYDLFAKFKAGTQVAMNFACGSDAGNKFSVSADRVQVTDFKYGDREGIAVWDVPLLFTEGTSGEPELTITFE